MSKIDQMLPVVKTDAHALLSDVNLAHEMPSWLGIEVMHIVAPRDLPFATHSMIVAGAQVILHTCT